MAGARPSYWAIRWGSVLGIEVAQRLPEWLYAYIEVEQLVDTRKSEEQGYQFALEQARAHHNSDAEKELLAVAPYPGDTGKTNHRQNRSTTEVAHVPWRTYLREDRLFLRWQRPTPLPDYTQRDLNTVDEGGLYSLSHLLGPFASIDLPSVTGFRCFLFEGRHDYTAPTSLPKSGFSTLKPPVKKSVCLTIPRVW